MQKDTTYQTSETSRENWSLKKKYFLNWLGIKRESKPFKL